MLNPNRKLIAAGFPRFPDAGATYIHNGVTYVFEACRRCGGTGEYSYNPMHGTTCFGCHGGRGTWVTKADSDRRARNRATAAARRARQAEAFQAEATTRWNALVDAHPLLAELSYRLNTVPGAAYGGILGELLGKFERFGSLSDKQIAFAEKLIRDDMAAVAELERQAAEKRAVQAVRANAPIGEVGDRLDFTGTVRFTSEGSNSFGAWTLIVIDTPNGAVKWFASGHWDLARGETVTLRATVKDHEVRGEEIFTKVTRGKLAE